MAESCSICGKALVPGPPGEWATRRGDYSVVLSNVPFLVCPAGCLVRKVAAAMLLKRVFLLSRGMSARLARRKGLFGTRTACPRCGEELADAGSRRSFEFDEPVPDGHPLRLKVEGPVLDCRACGESFLPPLGRDEGMGDLTGAIAEALSQAEDGA